MSRLIVKNLPKGLTEQRLRDLFGEKGRITDIQLKYTKDGVFRQFAFVGYQTEQEANDAVKFLDNTCINTSRITVEACAALGSDSKPKSWSKYSADSSKNQKTKETDPKIKANDDTTQALQLKTKKKKDERIDEIFGEHKNDPKFLEFLKVHGKGKDIWDNDLGLETVVKKGDVKKTSTITSTNEEQLNDNVTADSDTQANSDDDSGNDDDSVKVANQDISDSEYLKLLKSKKPESGKQKEVKKKEKKSIDLFTIKIRGIPFNAKRKDILKFFDKSKPFSVRLPTKSHGFCYVGFKTEKAFQKAMVKNLSFLNGKQLHLTDFTEKNKTSKAKSSEKEQQKQEKPKNPKWAKQEEALQTEEDISESGRIFFRNLTYSTNEEQIQKLFEKFGPIAEVNLPLDPITRQIKGFGTVTFVLPENAVQAFNELDGTIFQGRLLHLLPGKSKDTDDIDIENMEGLSFKQKKELKLKQTANSAHNWNSLFLGANAVAESMAKNYQTTKEAILDTAAGGSSAAVRLALGETQLVMEMRNFLEVNDVVLDVFNKMPKKRSKTVILVKNLPEGTVANEIHSIFCKFGPLGRVVLPPSGITAIVEFLDPGEARAAFRKLAYSRFKMLPLYLEWAPENTFKTASTTAMAADGNAKTESEETDADNNDIKAAKKKSNAFSKENYIKIKKGEEIDEIKQGLENDSKNGDESGNDDSEVETEPEPGTTLFLRNLNFKTRENTIRNHFKHIGKIHHIQVAMKKDPSDPKNRVSLGYGFIQFKQKASLEKALKTMPITQIDNNAVELKRSDRTLKTDVQTTKRDAKALKQTGTKILVRNIPFQAKVNEVRDLFKAFGDIKSIRIPKKMTPGEDSHRGFGFVDFNSKSEAKKAFDALCHSTHLYGRRLVLEWAAPDEGVEELRKRTAQQFQGSQPPNKQTKGVFDGRNIKKFKDDDEEDDEEME